jgi:hypothetical protein
MRPTDRSGACETTDRASTGGPGQGDHHTHGAYPHVAVVARPTGAGLSYALVHAAVLEGEHELFPLPEGPVVMTPDRGRGNGDPGHVARGSVMS